MTTASVQDRDGAAAVVAQGCAKLPALQQLYVDGAYGGRCARALHATHGLTVEVVRHPGRRIRHVFHDTARPIATIESVPTRFVVLPRRWVVERTHAWNERWRRLVMHHDRNSQTSVAWVWLAEARLLVARLATS